MTSGTNDLCRNRLQHAPRLKVSGAFADRHGLPYDVFLIPETDERFNAMRPLRWIIPGVGRRHLKWDGSSMGYSLQTASTEELQKLAKRRGFTVKLID